MSGPVLASHTDDCALALDGFCTCGAGDVVVHTSLAVTVVKGEHSNDCDKILPTVGTVCTCGVDSKPCGHDGERYRLECGVCIAEDELAQYRRGFEDGLRCFAHWKDGREYVGTAGTRLSSSIKIMDSLHSYVPPEGRE